MNDLGGSEWIWGCLAWVVRFEVFELKLEDFRICEFGFSVELTIDPYGL